MIRYNFIFAMSVMLLFMSVQSQAFDCGKMEKVVGPVDILRVKPGRQKKDLEEVRQIFRARNKMKIQCQDVMVTNDLGQAIIQLTGDIHVHLAPYSRLNIEEFDEKNHEPTLIQFQYGQIRVIRKSLKEEKEREIKPLRIRNQVAVIAAPGGADFYVKFNPKNSLLEVITLQGYLQIEHILSGEMTLALAGQKILVAGVSKKNTGSYFSVPQKISSAFFEEINKIFSFSESEIERKIPLKEEKKESLRSEKEPPNSNNEELLFNINSLKEEF